MKFTLMGGTVLFITGVLIALAQLWLAPWSAAVFIKLEISLGALLAILVAIWFVRKEYKDYQGHRHNVSLDE